jgi:hypothetical protein
LTPLTAVDPTALPDDLEPLRQSIGDAEVDIGEKLAT